MLRQTIVVTMAGLFCCVLSTVAAQQGEGAAKQGDSPVVPLVLLAVNGAPPHAQSVLDEMTDYLKDKGINAKQVADNSKSRNQIVDGLKAAGAQSLIYFVVSGLAMGDTPKFTAQCFDSDGKELWAEKPGLGMSFSTSAAAKKMAPAMQKKFEPRLGGPCLPKK